jgi:hypothetical protein
MRVDPSTGLVITQPVETPVMRKTRTGAATDDTDYETGEELRFGDPVIDRAFTKYMTDVLVDISDTLKREREELDEESTHLEKQINALQLQLAEIKGQVAQLAANERGPRGERGERGLKGPPGRRGPKGDAGLSAMPTPTIKRWVVDRARYRATPVLSNNTCGPSIELRGLFEEFNKQTA